LYARALAHVTSRLVAGTAGRRDDADVASAAGQIAPGVREPARILQHALRGAVAGEAELMVEHRNIAEWHGKLLVDRDGEKIGKLEGVYVDVETDEPVFGTVKEGFIGRHLTFVPLAGTTIGPDSLQIPVSKELVKDAPNIETEGDELSQADESTLYHHYQLNYTPPDTESGRRLARR
jgi:PRC-barrel domain